MDKSPPPKKKYQRGDSLHEYIPLVDCPVLLVSRRPADAGGHPLLHEPHLHHVLLH